MLIFLTEKAKPRTHTRGSRRFHIGRGGSGATRAPSRQPTRSCELSFRHGEGDENTSRVLGRERSLRPWLNRRSRCVRHATAHHRPTNFKWHMRRAYTEFPRNQSVEPQSTPVILVKNLGFRDATTDHRGQTSALDALREWPQARQGSEFPRSFCLHFDRYYCEANCSHGVTCSSCVGAVAL
jgi:hypothetical protein